MTFKILSLDGGGIRGIIPGQILVVLERKLQQKSGNPNARLGEYFDMIAGTSTGSILAIAYVCPGDNAGSKYKFTAQQAVDVYLNYGHEIFNVSLLRKIKSLWSLLDDKFSAAALEAVLLKSFGDRKLSELIKATCIIAYDIKQRRPIIFTQHDAVKNNKNFLVRDLLRASTAAPTFFEAVQLEALNGGGEKLDLVDGGVVAYNPTLCAYSEALKFDGVNGLNDMMILSLGSGKELKPYSYPQAKNWGLLSWIKPTLDIALEGGPQMVEYHMGKMASTMEGSQFYRIQPSLYEADTEMDNASLDNIEKLRQAGILNAEEYDSMLEEVSDILLSGL